MSHTPLLDVVITSVQGAINPHPFLSSLPWLPPNIVINMDDGMGHEQMIALQSAHNLHDVEVLQIRVDTRTNNSLSSIGEKLSKLREMKLDNSVVPSIRDLGTSFRHVTVLCMRNCKLLDISGLSGFPAIRELYLSFNVIHDIFPISSCLELGILDLECNNISELWQVEFLSLCSCLRVLMLAGNPIFHTLGKQYYQEVSNILPTVAILDNRIASQDSQTLTQDPLVEGISAGTTQDSVTLHKGDQTFCGSPSLVLYSHKQFERWK